MSGEDTAPEAFFALVERIAALDRRLSQLQAAILAACHLDIAHDSRSFSNRLGLAHALVLREVTGLEAFGDMIAVTRRDPRTMRTHYEIGPGGLRLFA